MYEFYYDGPVTKFGICITNRWKGTTFAMSAKKAKSNLIYQFKKQYGYTSNTKIDIPGKVVAVGNTVDHAG